jgi:RNA polymerase sigma-70 factor (ECF subfamily)
MVSPSELEARERSKAEDSGWIDRALKGDGAALASLFEKYREKIYRTAFGYLHDKDDALDVTQEAFIKAFRSLAGFERESGFYTWLTRIAINLSIDLRRRKARKKATLLEDFMDGDVRPSSQASVAPDPARGVVDEELRERYLAALERLTEKHRTVFVLHTVEGMAYKDIAATLEISIGTVMSRLHYARKHLQELLADYLR